MSRRDAGSLVNDLLTQVEMDRLCNKEAEIVFPIAPGSNSRKRLVCWISAVFFEPTGLKGVVVGPRVYPPVGFANDADHYPMPILEKTKLFQLL